MPDRVKIKISVFFLFLFLLPTIEKGIHTHHHICESHDYASHKKFLLQEDHCLICDFTSSDSNSPIPANYFNFVPESCLLAYPFIENNFPQDAFLHLSPRAPPVT